MTKGPINYFLGCTLNKPVQGVPCPMVAGVGSSDRDQWKIMNGWRFKTIMQEGKWMDEKWIDASISSLLRRIIPTRNVILVHERM